MSIDTNLVIREADTADTHTIATLAHAVWPQAYGNILSRPQMEYMLDLFYSESALRQQMKDGHRFFLAEASAETVGFASISHDHTAGAYKIHKLYVLPYVQGKGVGKMLLDRLEQEVRQNNASIVRLNVNRNNPAKSFYERHGFAVAGQEDIAIGEGYFMNDFVMEKKIGSAHQVGKNDTRGHSSVQ